MAFSLVKFPDETRLAGAPVYLIPPGYLPALIEGGWDWQKRKRGAGVNQPQFADAHDIPGGKTVGGCRGLVVMDIEATDENRKGK